MLKSINVLKYNITAYVSTQVQYAKMPKPKKNKNPPKPSVDKTITTGPVTSINDDVRITILAKPGAKQNAITDLSPEGVGVQISAPPREGEANTELCRYIASILGVKKSAVSLDKGSKSRNKTIEVHGTKLTIDEVTDKLKKEMENG
ncbi:hypothetical protein LSH36_279g02072 [Paralvinella palmiformis]|uniref:Uncharacterized protein n=1 Tax=Paralvinella palmiformis TaxID=53620 RepID=A0AAD9JJS8_9ANNE|nr:hypothetical protein LSH36_279g02072 [Paralvinella palmiformis]